MLFQLNFNLNFFGNYIERKVSFYFFNAEIEYFKQEYYF